MTFESSKTLGGIGALLLFIGFIPPISGYTFGILPLIGLILLLIGMKGLADYYREQGIFNNALYATIIGIVGAVAMAAIAVGVLFTQATDIIMEIYPNWNGDWATLGQLNPADINQNIAFSNIAPLLATVLLMLVGVFVIVLVVAILYRKSLGLLRDKSGIGLFGSAGTVLLVGGVLTIIGIGLILVWIATLLIAIAFFQLKEPTAQAAQPYQYPPPQYPPPQT